MDSKEQDDIVLLKRTEMILEEILRQGIIDERNLQIKS